MRSPFKVLSVALVAIGIAGYVVWVRQPSSAQPMFHRTARARASPQADASRGEKGAPVASTPVPTPVDAKPESSGDIDQFSNEEALMKHLRGLWRRAPADALRLCRDAEAKYSESSDAAERQWIAVRALEALEQFHEARALAELMVQRYRGTHWAQDVERHVLVHPLDLPSREEQQRFSKSE